jgi:polyisoprenoid-binding protein YceI
MSTHRQTTQALPSGTWQVDPAHSTIGFEVRDMTQLFATVRGRFTDYDGTLVVGMDGTARSSATIRVASLTTDHAYRDEHLRSPDFLGAGTHPEIRFESDRIEVIDGDRIHINGRMALKGIEQPVQLEGRLLGKGVDQRGAERLAIAADGTIAFGPTSVTLRIEVSAIKAGRNDE